MARTHEAGAMHSPGNASVAIVPNWLRAPGDVNELLPQLWASSVVRGNDGALRVGGVDVRDLAAEHGTPAYVLDEVDFRGRATAFRDAFRDAFADLCGGADVYYAAKTFLCTGVVRWLAEDGLNLDVASGGEFATGLRGGMPAGRMVFHGNNKSAAELREALTAGIGRIVVDNLGEVDLLADIAGELGATADVMLRVTVGVEAHTHSYIATAHEDQKFGLSLSSGTAEEAAAAVLRRPELRLLGFHSHIGSQIFDTGGFEVAARRILGLTARVRREHGAEVPEVDLGGGFGIAYTSEHDPLTPADLARHLAAIVERECRAEGIDCPKVSVEPGRAIAGPSTFTLYEAGAVKDVELDGGARRRYVSVDGGMSDNIRTALYDADYSATLASRRSGAEAVLSRVVGKHCESGDVVVKDEFLPSDLGAGDLVAVPGTGAYCRSMASNYNHVLKPPVIAVRDGVARPLLRRETLQDLFALDVG
ncbi:diaminopimelate decarboxylase [Kineococcus xinjiangensis]|uniref:Diaminopimelate decarboxylase n=1 Tax=Kineococcus xinjiangensis TaxID=512762 RepID=A0A2S6IWG0_9ACTN|nr:diaminopimelate decarboxylase [Kineococcus xinjiangensis]PPK98678.1 diaminopimelate decarboxylase [Kineococcus xinjiangensis]